MAELMRTSNPALNDKAFRGLSAEADGVMTLNGTVNKTAILLLCAVATAMWVWRLFMQSYLPDTQTHNPAVIAPWLTLGVIGGFICAIVTIFKKEWSPVLAPVYALLEGLVLGGLSALFEVRFPGIAIQAVCLTFGTLLVLLLAYSSGMIKVTEKFRLGVVAATGAIAVFYVVQLVLGFFGVHFTSVNNASPLSIGVSVVIVIVAALNLVLDFDFIESGVRNGAPKYMEWYGAFGLMVTLVWLYLEILRLLSKMRSRN
jgi:uncharacterized YccA/Bax inhibitor family protein